MPKPSSALVVEGEETRASSSNALAAGPTSKCERVRVQLRWPRRWCSTVGPQSQAMAVARGGRGSRCWSSHRKLDVAMWLAMAVARGAGGSRWQCERVRWWLALPRGGGGSDVQLGLGFTKES